MAGRKKNEGEGINSLQDALDSIAADFGEGTVVKMSETPNIEIEVIPTGIAGIDVALGRGGLPRGRIIEVYGPESSGKTTLALNAVAQAQKKGLVTAYIDAEHALDPEYAEALGVDVDSMYLTQPNYGEQALEIVDRLVRSGEVGLIVVDSVAALVPRAELGGEMGDAHVGLQARMMSQALRKISGNANQTGTTIIFINQLREKIGVMFGCFQYSTRVTLADGTQEKIGKLVNQKNPDVEVLSYNPDTGKVEPKKIINFFNNGKADKFLQFKVASGQKNGYSQFGVTENHMISTPDGWEAAGDLKVGDLVLAKSLSGYSEVATVFPFEEVIPVPILDIHEKPKTRSMERFDIEVEGNHNYFADGVLVHNSPETTTGGKALKFYSSIRIDVRATEKITEGKDNFVGNKAVVKIIKNKIAPPFKRAELENKYGIGFDRWASLTKEAKKFGVVEGAGAWIKYEGESMRPKDFEELLKNDKAVYDSLYAKVMEALKNSLKKQSPSKEEKNEEFPPNIDPTTGEILDEEFGN